MKAPSKLSVYIIISTVLLCIIAVWSLNTGVYDFGGQSAFTVLQKIMNGDQSLTMSDKYVVWDVRAARIVMAILIGSMLAVSGTGLQGLFRNPLATGDLI
ncbi:MAG: iron chelate uptake ABC transporter family permease subunit, partial [Chryseobacterium gambrini]|nr:iron chelate uptake ABC transporter family permease subunit [Chryseobacterium gambrini]